MTFLDLFFLILTTSISAACGAYFGKKAELHFFKKNQTDILNQLKETTETVEFIRGEVDGINIIKQIKFEKYHSKRVEAIETIHGSLCRYKAVLIDFIYSNDKTKKLNNIINNKSDSKSLYKLTIERYNDFQNEFELKRLWIDESIVKEIEILLKKISDNFMKSIITSMHEHMGNTKALEDRAQINNCIEIEIPEMLEKLNTSMIYLLK